MVKEISFWWGRQVVLVEGENGNKEQGVLNVSPFVVSAMPTMWNGKVELIPQIKTGDCLSVLVLPNDDHFNGHEMMAMLCGTKHAEDGEVFLVKANDAIFIWNKMSYPISIVYKQI